MYRCVSTFVCIPMSTCFWVCMGVSVGGQVCALKGVCRDFYIGNVCDWYLYAFVEGERGLRVFSSVQFGVPGLCVPVYQWGRELTFLWGLSHAGWGFCVSEGEPSISGV